MRVTLYASAVLTAMSLFPGNAAAQDAQPKSKQANPIHDGSVADLKWNPDWKTTGRLVETRRNKADGFLELDIPDKAEVELVVSSNTGRPSFQFGLQPKAAAAQFKSAHFETWDDTLVLLYGDDFAEVGPIQARFTIRVFIDWPAGKMSAYDARGKLLAVSRIDEPKSRRGVYIQNQGDHLVIERLLVKPWDGSPPAALETTTVPTIYLGPDSGRGWQTKSVTEGLSHWSTDSAGRLSTNSRSRIFYPLDKMPDGVELELVVMRPASVRPKEWPGLFGIAFAEQDNAMLSFSASEEGLHVLNTNDGVFALEMKEPVAFPEAKERFYTLRVFTRKVDKKLELSVHAADGRLLGNSSVPVPKQGKGIAIWGRPGFAVSKVRLSKWDGTKPEPIPGG